MTENDKLDLVGFAQSHIAALHDLWKLESPQFGYYPKYQDVNSKSEALIQQLDVFAGARVLDIGCNSGLYSCLAGLHASQVTGCDVEPILINRARTAKSYFEKIQRCVNVDFQLANFRDSLKSSFDGILASLVLYHVGDEALDELSEYLARKRPIVVLQVRPARAAAFAKNPDWKVVSNTMKYGGLYSIEANIEFLRDCGYESVSVHGIRSTLFFDEYFPVIVARK